MGDWWKQWLTDFGWTQSLLLRSLDLGLVLALIHGASHYWGAPDAVDGQGIYYLDLASTISTNLRLMLLSFVLEK